MPAEPVILLSPDPIVPEVSPFETEEGAETQFLGVVRGTEGGASISGIDYTAYAPMAEQMLRDLVARAQAEHGPHWVHLQHRLGFVAAGLPSIIIRVRTRHSALSFEVCRWYLHEVKTAVPIWKRIVPVEK